VRREVYWHARVTPCSRAEAQTG